MVALFLPTETFEDPRTNTLNLSQIPSSPDGLCNLQPPSYRTNALQAASRENRETKGPESVEDRAVVLPQARGKEAGVDAQALPGVRELTGLQKTRL